MAFNDSLSDMLARIKNAHQANKVSTSCLKSKLNINVQYEFVERREGDVGTVVADNSLANKLLNWKPKRTIRDMCRDGWKWELNNVD